MSDLKQSDRSYHKYDVFRESNFQKGTGGCEWLGTVEGDSPETALHNAILEYECRSTSSLYVTKQGE